MEEGFDGWDISRGGVIRQTVAGRGDGVRSNYFEKEVIRDEVFYKLCLLQHHFNLSRDVVEIIRPHLLERLIFYKREPVFGLLSWPQRVHVEKLDTMLLQELAIADWFPRKRPPADALPGTGARTRGHRRSEAPAQRRDPFGTTRSRPR